jgi:hypothetical protein
MPSALGLEIEAIDLRSHGLWETSEDDPLGTAEGFEAVYLADVGRGNRMAGAVR